VQEWQDWSSACWQLLPGHAFALGPSFFGYCRPTAICQTLYWSISAQMVSTFTSLLERLLLSPYGYMPDPVSVHQCPNGLHVHLFDRDFTEEKQPFQWTPEVWSRLPITKGSLLCHRYSCLPAARRKVRR
jgi:hypothetical protein